MANKKKKLSPEAQAAKEAEKKRKTLKKIGKILLAVLLVVALFAIARFAWGKYRAGEKFGVNTVNDSTIEVTANRARIGEGGGYLTIKDGQKMEVATSFKKGSVHVFVYPNMVAEKPKEAVAESQDALPEDASELPEEVEIATNPETKEYKLIMEHTFSGNGTESFDIEPGDYFLWFRVDKKATTGTMTVQAK